MEKTILLGVLLFHGVFTQNIGEPCNNGNGICKKLTECEPLKNNFGVGFVNCNSGKIAIACCPKPKAEPTKIILTPEEKLKPHVQACNAFKTEVFEEKILISAHAVGAPTVTQTIDNCKPLPLPLIHGGEKAKPQEFPHMALLGNGENPENIDWFCGGTLISKKFVLTAAHCFFNSKNINWVRLGELDYKSTTDLSPHVDFGVIRVVPHPDYNNTFNYNDIGLIELDSIVKITKSILPACLPTSGDKSHMKFTAAGWGSTNFAGPQSSHLLKVVLERFSDDECKKKYMEDYDNLPVGVKNRIQLCAGSRVSIKDTCQGDSGGPLFVRHSENLCLYTVVGITSFGDACGFTVGNAAIYTRVDLYIDWLERIVWPYGFIKLE